jgi:lipopolysaccharide transport protein LptA
MTAKIVFVCLAALLCLFGPRLSSAGEKNGAPSASVGRTVDIQADYLAVVHEKKTATFKGHVRAVFGRIRLTCAKMTVRYNDKGEAASLDARGNVTVLTEDAEASAGLARLDVDRGILVLEKNPVVAKGPHRLKGSRIEVQLKTGRVEVSDAKGTFRLKPEAGP